MPGARAAEAVGESVGESAVLASSQLTVLEPGYEMLSLPAGVEAGPGPGSATSGTTPAGPEQPDSALPGLASVSPLRDIDLERVQDLGSIVDDARKQAQTEYLAEKLGKPARVVRQYVHLAWEEARRRAGLSPELLIAIMHKESTFQPKVQSSYGAQGLMQVVRRWHREKLQATESLFDPAVNVRVGADILEEYLQAVGGDLSKALAKYSGNSRGYARTVIGESRKLAQVADTAAADVAVAPWLFDEPSTEYAG